MAPKNPNTMDTAEECWHYHTVDRVAPGDDAGAYWIFEAKHAHVRSTADAVIYCQCYIMTR
jgi:hypothetical protein